MKCSVCGDPNWILVSNGTDDVPMCVGCVNDLIKTYKTKIEQLQAQPGDPTAEQVREWAQRVEAAGRVFDLPAQSDWVQGIARVALRVLGDTNA